MIERLPCRLLAASSSNATSLADPGSLDRLAADPRWWKRFLTGGGAGPRTGSPRRGHPHSVRPRAKVTRRTARPSLSPDVPVLPPLRNAEAPVPPRPPPAPVLACRACRSGSLRFSLVRGVNEHEPVPHLHDARAEPVIDLPATVRTPVGGLVEPPSSGIALDDPEYGGAEARRAEFILGGGEEQPTEASPTVGRVHVEDLDLTRCPHRFGWDR